MRLKVRRLVGEEHQQGRGIYPPNDYLNEIFVRLVEEQDGVKITSPKQLQEITGITEIYVYWHEHEGKAKITTDYRSRPVSDELAPSSPYESKEKRLTKEPGRGGYKTKKEEVQAEATKQMEDTFLKAMQYRYQKR